ncbi:MAG: type II toxin-antitoxin system HicA family toxin [Bdellovibrionales bacterium]|nr:type II toxin-antitoxin system HicA family toxin [Bdellovibrionales bacterium]
MVPLNMGLNSKHQKTLQQIFQEPVKSDVLWKDVEKLILALGGQQFEGRGSRVRFRLEERLAVFHRPHPKPHTDKGALKSVRKFLINALGEKRLKIILEKKK